jgi:hypothetical protein
MNMENNKIQKNFWKWHFLEENQMDILVKLMKNLTKEKPVIEIITEVKNIKEQCTQKMMKCDLILDIL